MSWALPAPAGSAFFSVKTPWRWAVLGAVCGAVLAALVFAPAQWLADGVASLSSERVLLQDLRGTLWQGSARVVLSGGRGTRTSATLPGRVDWQTRITPAGLSLALQAACCMKQPWTWLLVPRFGGVQASLGASESQWPAELLSGLGTPWNTLQPRGRLRLSTSGLRLDFLSGRGKLTGSAVLEALEISTRLSTLESMGSYRLELQGGESPTLALRTSSGALLLTGQGQWVGSQLRFQGEASAAAGYEGVLSNLLNIIGRRQGARSIIQVG